MEKKFSKTYLLGILDKDGGTFEVLPLSKYISQWEPTSDSANDMIWFSLSAQLLFFKLLL